ARARRHDSRPRARASPSSRGARAAHRADPIASRPLARRKPSVDLATCRYIVVEGPIGAGKTSLARQLAHHIDGEELLEHPEENPFLARFYEDMARYALPAQLTFLFQRVDQLRGVGQFDLFHRATVADF